MSLYWLQPEWKLRCCANCGIRIWPEGDPDWGYCVDCYDNKMKTTENFLEYACEKAGHPCLYLYGESQCTCKKINYFDGKPII